ncbi:hypothetical protein NHP194003_01060 [Helicobacter suis]|uniref:Uncharacterized protein n=1 Tax=Helicobacter suis TaxID=104628 RepID=A0A6J4CXM9_9HELI|nr:hypothetical protein NHP190020_01080 [Helicobacter suis]BCD46902.1 hypothetical protein NHP194003_01060 [Helicobacter suis]BCD48660.1 hypothetical protein NHP194004_01070 [Helicobacter suis]BCD50436.1 hypothetical protein NHP194022_01070 [Helicobacter suis]BCD69463.1 hypothetical protein SNTW_01080 [Helicobacter suis]
MSFLPILLIDFFALLLPGPDFLIVSSYALKTNFKSAFLVVCGVSLGCFFLDYSLIKWIKNGFRGFPSHENFINSLWHVLSVLSSVPALKEFKAKREF